MEKRWKCVGDCGREFGIGEWECAPGVNHKVAPKEYYLLDAPQGNHDPSGASLKSARTFVENCPPERRVKDPQTHELVPLPGGRVTFIRGYAVVNDAEQQFWLEKHGHGHVTREQWERVYLNESEKSALRENKIRNKEAEAERKLAEANALLDSVKSSKSRAAVAEK